MLKSGASAAAIGAGAGSSSVTGCAGGATCGGTARPERKRGKIGGRPGVTSTTFDSISKSGWAMRESCATVSPERVINSASASCESRVATAGNGSRKKAVLATVIGRGLLVNLATCPEGTAGAEPISGRVSGGMRLSALIRPSSGGVSAIPAAGSGKISAGQFTAIFTALNRRSGAVP